MDLLREYWLEYFKEAGAHVEGYSVLRELRGIEPEAPQNPVVANVHILAVSAKHPLESINQTR